jgi:hypothetical protein
MNTKSIPFRCLHCQQIIEIEAKNVTMELIYDSTIDPKGMVRKNYIRIYKYKHCQFDIFANTDKKDEIPKEVLTEDFMSVIHSQKRK